MRIFELNCEINIEINMLNAWKKIKRSGSYYRNKKHVREDFMRRSMELRDEIISKRKYSVRQPIPVPPPIVNLQQQIIVRNNHHNSQPQIESTQLVSDQTGVLCIHEFLCRIISLREILFYRMRGC